MKFRPLHDRVLVRRLEEKEQEKGGCGKIHEASLDKLVF